ncbi:hypothetical protein AB0M02_08485 [Actinoplanes sp. NPDC051861]|uniref:hypothetical protein n=1 Tax=Actinoplanes sp. NPDC051861 TaxID=3155170 RepID=UPI0034156993
MLSARRLATAVAVASLALGGLSACRSQPNVAAYIGDSGRISEQRVQEVWDEVHTGLTDAAAQQPAPAEGEQAAPAGVRMPISRADVLRALIGQQVYANLAKQRGISFPAGVPYDEIAQQLGVPAGTEYARLAAQVAVYRQELGQKVTAPAAPTEEDMRSVYDALAEGGMVEPGQDFAAWSAAVTPANQEAVARAGAIRQELEKTVDTMDIEVSPRYHPFEFDLLSTQGENGLVNLLGAQVGEDLSAPVTDAR